MGNLEDDFGVVGQADWIIEVIVENLKIKRQLMERIDAVRQPHSYHQHQHFRHPGGFDRRRALGGFRQHFLGTHFFNPPRYLKLLEIIPTARNAARGGRK